MDNRRLGNYDVTRAGWCADYNDPTAFLNILLSKSSNNDMKYKSAEFDSTMVKTLEAATDAGALRCIKLLRRLPIPMRR